MITDANGGVLTRYDYEPFGVNCAPNPPCVAQPAEARQFVGKERDTDTGFDYFGARYYEAVNGRFTTVDPALHVDLALIQPQRWNRYAHTLNNPLRFVDPDGRQGIDIANQALTDRWLQGKMTTEEYEAALKANAYGVLAGGSVVAAIWGGPVAWRAAVGCFLSPSCQNAAAGAVEGMAGGPPRITPLHDIDPAAVALARKLGGQASVAIEGFANEFDAVSPRYVAQTTNAVSALLKPGNYLSSSRRAQIKATLQAARALGRKAYFEFTNGVHSDVIDYIRRNAAEVGVDYVIDR
jgi:RHS repeat-associated protein